MIDERIEGLLREKIDLLVLALGEEKKSGNEEKAALLKLQLDEAVNDWIVYTRQPGELPNRILHRLKKDVVPVAPKKIVKNRAIKEKIRKKKRGY